ncbi:MAG: hypothetical protein ACI9U2_003973 [Bradymonadia bacterium]|jgi:hypothetical protein
MSDFLDPLRLAHEEEYFQRHNQELLEKLRARQTTEAAAVGIKGATGVQDAALVETLARLGVTRETVAVLHLMPLLAVAWADGAIQDEERALLHGAADEAKLEGKALEAFEAMLLKRPKQIYFDVALEFIHTVLTSMPAADADKARANIQSLTETIANCTGGWFGVFGNVSDEEESALAHISSRLNAQAAAVLGKL